MGGTTQCDSCQRRGALTRLDKHRGAIVVIEHADFEMRERVGAKMVFIDLDDQLAVAAKGPKRAIR